MRSVDRRTNWSVWVSATLPLCRVVPDHRLLHTLGIRLRQRGNLRPHLGIKPKKIPMLDASRYTLGVWINVLTQPLYGWTPTSVQTPG